METSWARSLGGLNHPSTKEVRENISASTGNDLAGGIFFSHLYMLKYRFLFRINPVFKQVYLLTESYILSPYSVAWQAVHMQNVYKLDGYFFFFFSQAVHPFCKLMDQFSDIYRRSASLRRNLEGWSFQNF